MVGKGESRGSGVSTGKIRIQGKLAQLKICRSSSHECTRTLENEKNALLCAGKEVKVSSILAYGKKKVGKSHHSYIVLESMSGAPFMPARDYKQAALYLSALHARTQGKHTGTEKYADAAQYLLKEAARLASILKKSKTTAKSARKTAFLLLAVAKRSVKSKTKNKAEYLSLNNAYPMTNNWVKTPQGIALRNWSHAALATPALDIALFLSPFCLSWNRPSELSDEAQSAFFDAYLARFTSSAQEEIISEYERLALPASAYLLLLALTEGKESSGRHFSNHLFLKKALSLHGQKWLAT